ncbi:MAG: ABC transporter permease [Phycisphaeraceae bacterium]|nr:ABC transporter permease [Phycisphaeraceae bacterium]
MNPLALGVAIARLGVQTVVLALQQIWANQVRSLLTTLGIIIGVSSIIAVIAALQGLRQNILNEFEKFGTRKVWVDGTLPPSMRGTHSIRDVQLTLHEIEAIRERVDAIDLVSPMFFGGYSIEFGGERIDAVSTIGIVPEWHDVEGRQVIRGRTFNAIDMDQARRVCLINDKGIEELGLNIDPTGQYVNLSGQRFLVVGVVETIQFSAMFGGRESNAEVFIPLTTAMEMNPDGWINFAWTRLKDTGNADDAIAEIRFVLRKLREIGPEDLDTFEVRVIQQFIDQFNRLAGAITAGAGGIVGISLLVGGIGIMNIMLVSVSERTREIGLRKAVGAKSSVILAQFLVEAVTLCLLGGAIGLVLGQLMVEGMRSIPNFPLKDALVPAWAVVLSVGFSAATGVIFGMFPALKAARLDPIEALRHE